MAQYTTVTELGELRGANTSQVEREEWELRIRLAAAYRIFDHFGWTQLIFGHIIARVPGPERHFLINPFGLLYDEVTASSLVKIDIDGNIIGDSEHPVNPAGFVIHSAIHAAREDARCVIHTHAGALEAGAQADLVFAALMRLMDRRDPSYRD
jgi:ribulose-5-phosphate 4-epimerase/fuculose-1-phosphate aldolase